MTYGPIAQALWLTLPVILAGLTHVVAIKRDVLRELARVPIDGGIRVRGRPLFGVNKTLRGAVIMIVAALVWTSVFDQIQLGLGLDESLRFIARDQLGSLGLGLLLGVGYILGELPNSFVKRQLDIEPGDAALGLRGRVFWVVDQVDSSLAVLLVLTPIRVPTLTHVATVLLVTMLVHPAVAAVMVRLGLKRRIG